MIFVGTLSGEGPPSPGGRREWNPTAQSFERLLRWLNAGGAPEGEKYEEMRRRLISYFDRKNCAQADILADEVFTRVMKWLEEKSPRTESEPAKICYTTARFVFHESLRGPKSVGVDELPPSGEPRTSGRETDLLAEIEELKKKRLECLETCSRKLEAAEWGIITRYYQGEGSVKLKARKELASEHGLSPNALSIKACRIRGKLRVCMERCCA